MPDLATEIRNYYESVLVPVDEEEIVARSTRRLTPPGPVPRRLPGWAVAVSTAAVVLVIGGFLLLLTPFGGDRVPPSDDPTTTTAVPVGPEFAPSDLGTGWTKVAGGEVLGSTGVDRGKIVVAGPGLLVSGEACDKTVPLGGPEGSPRGTLCGPIILTSVDGQAWVRVGDDPFGTGLINDVAAYGSGAVAVGSTCQPGVAPTEDTAQTVSRDCAPAVWVSPDGLSWARIEDDAAFAGCFDCAVQINTVTVAGTRVVALGQSTAGSAAWTSDDGETWRLSGTEEAFAGISGPEVVVASGSEFIAAGFGCREVIENDEVVDIDCSTTTWISQDGTEWTRQSPNEEPMRIADVASFGSGVVAVGLIAGGQSGEQAAAWYSPDGVTWARAQVEDQAAGTMHRVVASGTGLVAFSGELPEGRTVIWVSSDGQNWSRAPIDPPELATAAVTSAKFTPSGIVVLGRDFASNERAIWMWASPNP